jgi:hypothetical protein
MFAPLINGLTGVPQHLEALGLANARLGWSPEGEDRGPMVDRVVVFVEFQSTIGSIDVKQYRGGEPRKARPLTVRRVLTVYRHYGRQEHS